MSEDIDYQTLFYQEQAENELLKAAIKQAGRVRLRAPDLSWLVRWYNRDPMRAMYTVFTVCAIVGTLLQCIALWKDIRNE